MGLISSRDFIDACAVRPLPDGGLITAASAVDSFPETPGCVRGKNRSCGLTFRPTGEGIGLVLFGARCGCSFVPSRCICLGYAHIPLMCFLVAASGVKICWVIHSDLGGSLPVALIDRAIPGSVMVASRVSLSSLRITARFITHTNTVCR